MLAVLARHLDRYRSALVDICRGDPVYADQFQDRKQLGAIGCRDFR